MMNQEMLTNQGRKDKACKMSQNSEFPIRPGDLNLSEEDRDILNDFISESNESIEEIEPLLIELEENSVELETVDPALLNKIFRVFHSIKGSASFIGLSLTSAVTHHAETLLDMLRKEVLTLKKEHIDIFLELCDFFTTLLDHIHQHFSEAGFEEQASHFSARLEDLVLQDRQSAPANKPETSEKATGKSKRTTTRKLEAQTSSTTDNTGFDIDSLIGPEMVVQFIQDSRELLDGLESDLMVLEKMPENKDQVQDAFRALHSLKGNAGFFGYEDISVICHRAESFLDQVRDGKGQATSDQYATLLQIMDFIRIAVDNLEKGEPPSIPGKAGVMDLMEEFLSFPEENNAVAEIILSPSEEKNEPEQPGTQPSDNPEEIEKKAKEIPLNKTAPPTTAGTGPIKKQENDKHGKSGSTNEVIRVDVNKLNTLMDLVGEIVIAESMVSQHPDVIECDMPGFEKAALHLQKNIRELQDLATSMRMIPLNGLFRKMIRLVRDLSNKNSKRMELEIFGGETEVDRSVIEHISDPLVHLIRNSVDHGIESAEDRANRQKPAVGKITLDASQVGGEIWIKIQDDGRGLNRKKILAKAHERGLVNGNSEELPDEKVWELIFSPGFSTAEKVTDISGRGVGMDVVRRNIEKIRGRIDVRSELDVGTTIILRIPLTTAIIDGMLIRVHNSLYAIPMLDIKESFQVSASRIVRLTDGQEVVKVRDNLLPVVRIHEMHDIYCERKELVDGILIVVENGGKSICLFADELIEQKQLVIKPLPDYIGELQCVSGCAILGNGEICLILDVADSIKTAESLVKI